MLRDDEVYTIGTITRTHGVRGEVAFRFTDDVWDRVEADYLLLRIEGLLVPFFLEEWRFRSDDVALLKFEDIDNVDAAVQLVGAEVSFPKALTPEYIDDEDVTWSMMRGFAVENEGQRIGTVAEVYDQTENVLLDIQTPDGESVLIPANEQFVLRADHRERVLYVSVPDELLSLNAKDN